jgi:hypothetical protein
MPPRRKALLVGSLPFENEAEAMGEALRYLGPDLIALPDGEIGEKTPAYPRGKRAAWTQCIVDTWEHDTANWEVRWKGIRGKHGFPLHYALAPWLRPKHPPESMDKHLDLKWVEYFQASYPVFKRLRAERGLPDLKFQIGLPTALGILPVMRNPLQVLRYTMAFSRRMAYEANRILALADPGDIVFQLEVPPELAMAYVLPKRLVDWPLDPLLDLVRQIEPRAAFGLHLCLGDLNNRALMLAPTLGKMVHFNNRLLERWPATHELTYVHFPLAEAVRPPRIRASWYHPLREVRLPPGVRFVAGFVHEGRTWDEHRTILNLLDELRGERVAVASSCGLGRRDRATAENLLGITGRLLAE